MIYQGIFNRLPAKLAFPQLGLWASLTILIVLSLLLFFPAFSWMFDAFTSQEHRFQLIGIMMLVAYLVYKQVENRTAHNWQLTLQLRITPIFLYLNSSLAFVLNEYFLDIHILSATFSVLAFYALYGLFTSHTIWLKGFIPTLLLIVLLPFGDYLNVYLGFPLRLFSAYMTADTLTALGYPSMSSETIIVLENRYSNVDLSCSGIKGIWSGLAFFVLLSLIENKSIGSSWFWRLALFLLALIAANILRITILVLLGSQFSYFEFADLIHEMLGIIGFTFACLFGWGLLLTQKTRLTSSRKTPRIKDPINRPQLTLLLLIISVAVMNIVYMPMPKTNTVTVFFVVRDKTRIIGNFSDLWLLEFT